MHSISGLSLVLHVHRCIGLLQQHGSSQFGTIFSCGWSSDFSTFTKMKQRDLVLDIRNLRISWTSLLWRLMQSLCMCGSMQHNSICSHIYGCIILHNEQFMLGYSSF